MWENFQSKLFWKREKNPSPEYKLKWKLIQYVCIANRDLSSREGNEEGVLWFYPHFPMTHGNKPILKPENPGMNFGKVVICYVKYGCVYIYIDVKNGTKNIILAS